MPNKQKETKKSNFVFQNIYNRFIEKLRILRFRKLKIISAIDKRVDEKKAKAILDEINKVSG